MAFDLKLLGGIELRNASGQLVKPASRKDLALLAYLAAKRRPCQRSSLAGLFWPDRPEAQARKSLRQSLVVLRRLFDGANVVLTGKAGDVSLNKEFLTVDLDALFGGGLAGGGIDDAKAFRGRLLEGFEDISPLFDNWLAVERTRVEDLAADLLSRRCRAHLNREEWADALATARQIVELAPFREEGRRLLMRALDGASERAQALQEFHLFSDLLREELDVSPDPETVALFRAIRGNPAAPALPKETPPSDTVILPRPGIVVLPFRVDTGGAVPASLSCGLPEELISTLAAYRWFYVISYLQASVYGEAPVAPQQLKSELGISYVATGRVERRGKKLLVRLELTSANTGEHLWSEKFETFADEILIAQDELARKVAAQIEPELVKAEADLQIRVPETNFDAWVKLMRARQLADTCQPQSVHDAVEMALDVLKDVPDSALAQGTLAYAAWLDNTFSPLAALPVEEGMAAAERAIRLDPRYYLGHTALGTFKNRLQRYDQAAPNLRRAIDANPSFPVAYNQLTYALSLDGRPAEALDWIGRLQEVSPNDPLRGFYGCVRSVAHYLLGDFKASVENGLMSLEDHPGWPMSELITSAALQREGRCEEARRMSQAIVERNGCRTREQIQKIFRPRREMDLEMIIEPLIDLGLAK